MTNRELLYRLMNLREEELDLNANLVLEDEKYPVEGMIYLFKVNSFERNTFKILDRSPASSYFLHCHMKDIIKLKIDNNL